MGKTLLLRSWAARRNRQALARARDDEHILLPSFGEVKEHLWKRHEIMYVIGCCVAALTATGTIPPGSTILYGKEAQDEQMAHGTRMVQMSHRVPCQVKVRLGEDVKDVGTKGEEKRLSDVPRSPAIRKFIGILMTATDPLERVANQVDIDAERGRDISGQVGRSRLPGLRDHFIAFLRRVQRETEARMKDKAKVTESPVDFVFVRQSFTDLLNSSRRLFDALCQGYLRDAIQTRSELKREMYEKLSRENYDKMKTAGMSAALMGYARGELKENVGPDLGSEQKLMAYIEHHENAAR